MSNRLVMFVVLIGLAVSAASCAEDNPLRANTWTFMNRSSYTVTVNPNGQVTWSGFALGAGQDREVTVHEDGGDIHYNYGPSNLVSVDESEIKKSRIIFRNR